MRNTNTQERQSVGTPTIQHGEVQSTTGILQPDIAPQLVATTDTDQRVTNAANPTKSKGKPATTNKRR